MPGSRSKSARCGDKFGGWTVIDGTPNFNDTPYPHFLVRCACGVEKLVNSGSLRNGKSQSCGCIQKEWFSTMGRSRTDNLLGVSFGRLSPIRYEGKSNWFCRCECGNALMVTQSRLRSGKTKSCGCLNAELSKQRKLRHGMTYSPTWNVWAGIQARCGSPDHKRYDYYGGSGVKVSDRWLGDDGFRNFLADMGERPKGLSLDRFPNPYGNYEPGNCRWATTSEQNNNKRRRRTQAELAVTRRYPTTKGSDSRLLAD